MIEASGSFGGTFEFNGLMGRLRYNLRSRVEDGVGGGFSDGAQEHTMNENELKFKLNDSRIELYQHFIILPYKAVESLIC